MAHSSRHALLMAAGIVLAAPAQAAETRGFVIDWFQPAMYSTKDDCAGGTNNLSAEKLFERILKEQKTPPAEMEKLLADFPGSFGGKYSNRGVIDGKPVNAYLNPTSVTDPNIKIGMGRVGYGFNLDGKTGPQDFTDPDTGEKGVDNLAARAMGCFSTMRGGPTERPTHLTSRWEETRGLMPAWLVEVSGIDDFTNDDNVTLGFFRAKEPGVRDNNTVLQGDMTFHADHNPRSWHMVPGRIKNGVVYTDVFDFHMIGDPFHMAEYTFDKARIRLSILPSRDARGVIGGYMPFTDLYLAWALTGTLSESMLSVDLPGFYYALRKLADSNPDPKTGMNMNISTSFTIEAKPAFIVHQDEARVSQAGK